MPDGLYFRMKHGNVLEEAIAGVIKSLKVCPEMGRKVFFFSKHTPSLTRFTHLPNFTSFNCGRR